MSDQLKLRILLAGAVAILALEVFFSGHTHSSGPAAGAVTQESAATPDATPSQNTQTPASGAADQGNFAIPAYHGSGVSVIGRDGKYCLNAIRVAVPGAGNQVAYLSGTDPAAIAYMAEMQATHRSMIVDNGPSDVDTSQLPPQGTVMNQAKHVGVSQTR